MVAPLEEQAESVMYSKTGSYPVGRAVVYCRVYYKGFDSDRRLSCYGPLLLLRPHRHKLALGLGLTGGGAPFADFSTWRA